MKKLLPVLASVLLCLGILVSLSIGNTVHCETESTVESITSVSYSSDNDSRRDEPLHKDYPTGFPEFD